MTPKAFVRILETETPTPAQLASIGLTKKEAADFRRSYAPIENAHAKGPWSDPIDELLERWNWQKVAIGMVRIAKKARRTPTAVVFGKVDEDRDSLASQPATGEIVVLAAGNPAKIVWKVALSFDRFLDALAVAVRHFSRCVLDDAYYDDLRAARGQALECAVAAGGKKYRDFYRCMFGV